MKPRTLLILLLLVAGLGAFIWFYERDLPSSEERGERAKKLLGGVESDEVVALEIESPEGRVRLERAAPDQAGDEAGDEGSEDAAGGLDEPGTAGPEAEWHIVEPTSLAGARADRFAVERLLDRLTGLDKVRALDDPDRAQLGLEEPRGRITLELEGGDKTTLELGAEVPASSSSLVGLAGRSEAWVVAGKLASEIGKAPGEWRDAEVFPLRRDEVERLVLAPGPAQGGGGRIVLARRGETFWLDEPIVDRAESEEVEGLLTELVGLRAARFVDEPAAGDGADPGLDPPRATIEAYPAGGEPLRLELGAAESSPAGGPDAPPVAGDTYFARVGSQVFTASAPILDRIRQDVSAWQSLALTGRRLYQIDRVRVDESETGEEGGLLLRREGADWRRGEEAIPYSVVSDLLFAVTDARGERLLRRAGAAAAGVDLDAPILRLTFEGGDEPEVETVALYPPTPDGETPATVTGRDFVLLLAPSTAETLTDSLRRLREAEPIPEDEAAVDDGLAIEMEEGDTPPNPVPGS